MINQDNTIANLANLVLKYDNLEDKVNEIETTVTNHGLSISDNTSDISSLVTRVSSTESSISTLTANLATTNSTLATTTSNANTAKTDAATAISIGTGGITRNSTSITSIGGWFALRAGKFCTFHFTFTAEDAIPANTVLVTIATGYRPYANIPNVAFVSTTGVVYTFNFQSNGQVINKLAISASQSVFIYFGWCMA